MKSVTVRLPERPAADIEAESRERGISRSDVVRERLESRQGVKIKKGPLDDIAHLIGSVDDDLPEDMSAQKMHYLRATGYGRNRAGAFCDLNYTTGPHS